MVRRSYLFVVAASPGLLPGSCVPSPRVCGQTGVSYRARLFHGIHSPTAPCLWPDVGFNIVYIFYVLDLEWVVCALVGRSGCASDSSWWKVVLGAPLPHRADVHGL